MTRQKSLMFLSTIGTIAILGIGWMIGIQPQLGRISKASHDREIVVAQNQKDEQVLAKLKHDYQSIDLLKSQLVTLRKSVPIKANFSSFVTEMGALARQANVEVKSISIAEAKNYTPNTGGVNQAADVTITNPRISTNNFILIPVQFSLSGSYSKVLDFIHAVQTGDRLFLISNLGSTASGVVADAGKVDVSVGGYIYSLLNI